MSIGPFFFQIFIEGDVNGFRVYIYATCTHRGE